MDTVCLFCQVAETMKSDELDESDVNTMIGNTNDIKTLKDARSDQHKVNNLTVKHDDQLHSTKQDETTDL